VTAGVVAELQRQPTFQGLAVCDPGFGLDSCSPPVRFGSADLRVPGSEISGDWQWHLSPPAQRWMEAPAKALEERQLRPIPNRIPNRVGADAQIEAHHRTKGANELQGSLVAGALESADLGVRHADRQGDFPLAESGADSGSSRVQGHAMERLATAPSPSIGRPFSCRHRRRWSHRALHRGFTRSLEHPLFQRASDRGRASRWRAPDPRLEHVLFQRTEEPPRSASLPSSVRRLEHRVFRGRVGAR
jgi:hypothetical protein